ncbi:PREDICTED: nuclear pore complex protein GP210 [Theobroma cacao]|uniref:Nuclear pore complex protein GP210 n=1 Tax=Theobroma cacao TaxID=3641 RepID=A0AB32V7L9_THECC|nr:PREDICTED: nuclear pore complex protein GP210 [Theobroma cacao]
MIRLSLLLILTASLTAVTGTTSHSSSGPHIADVNILLPPRMTNPVEYRLQGSDGCFKWSWDHHEILSVLPEYNVTNHCSTSARLRSIAPYSGRKETAVYARDVYTGIVIRCKVFIDNFDRIQIFHNSIKLDLDGLATLRVRAFDSEDNVFSSLVGLQFMWQLMPKTNGPQHHLAHVPLKDSPLSDCGGLCGDLDIQIQLEEKGVFSDLFVARGIHIGHENVSVQLLEPLLEGMGDKIVLTVAEAMSLDPPSPVFVLINATLRYSLKVIRGTVPQEVTFPSPHHQWSVSNCSVAQVDSMLGVINALTLGETTVIVEDTRVDGHSQLSSLNVVLPDTLSLYISLLSTSGDPLEGMEPMPSVAHWYVVSGKQYLIQLKVFSQGPYSHEIYITENDDVEFYDNQSGYWKIVPVLEPIASRYGWRNSRILKATSEGMGKLTASLVYYNGHHDIKEVLKVVQEVIVCDPVKFSSEKITGESQIILLPWAPAVYQEMELKATGGCAKASSDYKWFSSDMTVVSFTAYGVVQAKKPGKATVKVVSSFDSFNYDEVVVEVSIPSSMVMLQNFPVESAVGSHLPAAVTMKASNGVYFSRCDAFHSFIKWKAGSESFIVTNATREVPVFEKQEILELHAPVYGPPCSWTYVYASASGQAMLHAAFSKEFHHFDPSFSGPIVLKATSRIAAYQPLTLHQAGDGNHFGGYWVNTAGSEAANQLENLDKLYLVPGTHLDVVLHGGPERWDKGVDFRETVEIFDEERAHDNGVHMHQISSSHGILYRILCQTMGTYNLVFKRGNLIGDDHPLPAVAEVSLSLACSLPSSIVVIVDEPVNDRDVIRTAIQADRIPGQIHVTPVTVANGQTIRVAAVSISTSGEPFANSSSLCLKWELGNCDSLAYWDYAYDSESSKKSSWERFLVLQNESGSCIVRATVTGFLGTSTADRYSAKLLESSNNFLTDAARLQLVSTLRVSPEFNLLYFNPDAKANLSITGGSCFLEAVVNDSRVVEVTQPPPGLQCLQMMLSPKGLGTALVTVYDIGLAPNIAASVVVQVADVDWIKIMSGEEISLMEGSSQSIDLMAGVDDGSTFDISQYAFMNIHVHIEDDTVELVDKDDISTPGGGYIGAQNFKVRAKHLGITTLYVSGRRHSGHEILSQVIKVEVYAPPTIHPHDIFLVPGASYMLTMKGGPTIGAFVEYTSIDDGIAKVHKTSGRLTATSPGNTTLVATVYGNGDSVICQAYGSVKVGVPSSAILNVQSEQLAVGREATIYPLFPEGDLFSFYELCKDYKWTIEDEEVLKFGVPLVSSEAVQHLSTVDKEELKFINVFYGRAPGRTNVAVSFSCDFISFGSHLEARTYSASISLLVVSDLPLALGAPITWVLPPHYTTSSILPLSTESHGQRDSQSRKGSIIYSLLRNWEEATEVSQRAVSIDGDKIKTKESNNLACIQAKDRITGRTEIASCVRVAEVEQIRITNKEFLVHAIDLAVGAETELSISYFDALGNAFYEASNVILPYAETNYPDVVSVNTTHDTNSIHLKAMRHGRALLRVSIDNRPQKSDYMLISVGAHVHPQNPVLHQGSSINFNVVGSGDQASGHWLSANESVIVLHMQSGQAEAVGEGLTQVSFESSGVKLQTTVTVLPESTLVMDAPREMLTNVPFPSQGYSFSVKFSDTKDKINALGSSKGAPYDCRVDPPFVGYAKPWMDLETGNSFCLFFPYSPEHLVHTTPKFKNMKPYMYVSINATVKEHSHVSGSASALFVGGFSIMQMGKNIVQLNLTPNSNKTIITILGNTDVDIRWHNQDLLMITPIQKEEFGVGGCVHYEVKALGAKQFKDKIIVTLPSTGQRAEVDVNYERASIIDITVFNSWIRGSALLALIIAIFIRILYLPSRPFRFAFRRPSTPPPTPSISAPVTPERSSPAVPDEQSPRTPQPFVDYVRRTIDETPYYKREGRRRFNPQKTY